jgi:hypothetical protein
VDDMNVSELSGENSSATLAQIRVRSDCTISFADFEDIQSRIEVYSSEIREIMCDAGDLQTFYSGLEFEVSDDEDSDVSI